MHAYQSHRTQESSIFNRRWGGGRTFIAAGMRGYLAEELLLSWALTDGQNNYGHSVVSGGKKKTNKLMLAKQEQEDKEISKGSNNEHTWLLLSTNKGKW